MAKLSDRVFIYTVVKTVLKRIKIIFHIKGEIYFSIYSVNSQPDSGTGLWHRIIIWAMESTVLQRGSFYPFAVPKVEQYVDGSRPTPREGEALQGN